MTEGSEVVPVSTVQMTRKTDKISVKFQKPEKSPACLEYREEPTLLISWDLKYQQALWAFCVGTSWPSRIAHRCPQWFAFELQWWIYSSWKSVLSNMIWFSLLSFAHALWGKGDSVFFCSLMLERGNNLFKAYLCLRLRNARMDMDLAMTSAALRVV